MHVILNKSQNSNKRDQGHLSNPLSSTLLNRHPQGIYKNSSQKWLIHRLTGWLIFLSSYSYLDPYFLLLPLRSPWKTIQLFSFFFFKCLFIFERERESTSRRGVEGDTEFEAGCRLQAPAASTKPNTGLEPTDHEITTWAKVGRPTDWAPRYP